MECITTLVKWVEADGAYQMCWQYCLPLNVFNECFGFALESIVTALIGLPLHLLS